MRTQLHDFYCETSTRIHIGYGILVNKQIIAFGLRKAIVREHARMLAFKSVVHSLPAELLKSVSEPLYRSFG